MKENGMIRAAPSICAAILIVLLGMLVGQTEAYGYQPGPMGGMSSGPAHWGTPSRSDVVWHQQRQEMYGPRYAPVLPQALQRLPGWPASSTGIIPPMMNGLSFYQRHHPAAAWIEHSALASMSQPGWISPEPWRVPTSYTVQGTPNGYRSRQYQVNPQCPPWAFAGETRYRQQFVAAGSTRREAIESRSEMG